MQTVSNLYFRKNFRTIAVLFLSACPSLYMRISNIFLYKPLAGFDAVWHLTYITYLVKHGSLPSAYAFFEAYQPPLYYFICSLIWRMFYGISALAAVKAIQSLSTAAGIIIAWIVLRDVKRIHPQPFALFLCTFMFIVYLPMLIYLSPMLGNELFSALLLTIAISYLLSILLNAQFSIKQSLILGCLSGTSLLVKYTGLLFFITVIIVLAYVMVKTPSLRKKAQKFLFCYCIMTFCIAGWWYLHNAIRYENPLIKANDMKKFSAVYDAQPPGNHTIEDFICFDLDIMKQPVLAIDADFDSLWQKNAYANYNRAFNSIPAGTFATAWIENHGLFLNLTKETLWKAQLVLFLALIPTLLIFVGFVSYCNDFIIHRSFLTFTILTLLFVSVGAYLYYNYKYPYFCHVKAFFLMHLLIPVGVFHANGISLLTCKWNTLHIFFIPFYIVFSIIITLLYSL
ncbi:MAG: glycosyltransferase family 39 protein [bacterium]|nr:glycosyltransferase family 39 protein [bacterium]